MSNKTPYRQDQGQRAYDWMKRADLRRRLAEMGIQPTRGKPKR
jgi:hypothetical protein